MPIPKRITNFGRIPSLCCCSLGCRPVLCYIKVSAFGSSAFNANLAGGDIGRVDIFVCSPFGNSQPAVAWCLGLVEEARYVVRGRDAPWSWLSRPTKCALSDFSYSFLFSCLPVSFPSAISIVQVANMFELRVKPRTLLPFPLLDTYARRLLFPECSSLLPISPFASSSSLLFLLSFVFLLRRLLCRCLYLSTFLLFVRLLLLLRRCCYCLLQIRPRLFPRWFFSFFSFLAFCFFVSFFSVWLPANRSGTLAIWPGFSDHVPMDLGRGPLLPLFIVFLILFPLLSFTLSLRAAFSITFLSSFPSFLLFVVALSSSEMWAGGPSAPPFAGA